MYTVTFTFFAIFNNGRQRTDFETAGSASASDLSLSLSLSLLSLETFRDTVFGWKGYNRKRKKSKVTHHVENL